MTPLVTSIISLRPGGRARVIEVDETAWRTTSAAAIRIAGVREGDVVLLDTLAALLDEAEQHAVRERALAVLSYRERSVSELRLKLLEDGYPPAAVEAVAMAFVHSGLVDDERFADSFVRSAAGGRSIGRRRTERELAERGVAEPIATEALDRYMPLDAEFDRALSLAQRARRPSERVDRLAAKLVRKGFSPSVAFGAAREALSCCEDDNAPDADSGL